MICVTFHNKLYADDTKLYSCYHVTSSCDELSAAINQLCEWRSTWQLCIAIQKCSASSIYSHRSSFYSQKQIYKINNSALPSKLCQRLGCNCIHTHARTHAHIHTYIHIYWVAQLKWSQLTFLFVKFGFPLPRITPRWVDYFSRAHIKTFTIILYITTHNRAHSIIEYWML